MGHFSDPYGLLHTGDNAKPNSPENDVEFTRSHSTKEGLPQEVELATEDCKKMVAVLEQHMKDREFLVGNRLSVADFNAAYTLD